MLAPADLINAGRTPAVLAASIFHFGTSTVRGVKRYLARQGAPVRLPELVI